MADKVYRITSAEGTVFTYDLAPPLVRLGAWVLDEVVILVAMAAITTVLSLAGIAGAHATDLAGAIYYVAAFVVQWLYFVLCEWLLHGQTLGKKVMRVRVLDLLGLDITFMQALLRNLLRPIDFLPLMYLTGGMLMYLDPHRRRLGDLAAGTIAVVERRGVVPRALLRYRLRYNSLRDDLRLIAAARTQLTPHELEVMLALANRRDSLPLPVRRDLFERMARHLEARLTFARPAYLSDENFVLNVAALALPE